MTAAERAATAFGTEHDRPPRSVWSAPGRVNLVGEHTDYNDGFVLPLALPHRTAVAVAPRSDGKLTVATLGNDQKLHHSPMLTMDELSPREKYGWAGYPAGVAWVLRHSGITLEGADVVIVGEVPTGAGLSSSHALECAAALALLDVSGRPWDGPAGPSLSEIARWVQRTENEFVGAPTGLLDQTASLACTDAHALFFDVRSGVTEHIPFDSRAAGLELLVIDTRANHSHSTSGYGDRRSGCEQAAEMLGIAALRDLGLDDLPIVLPRLPDEIQPLVRHVVTENDRVLSTVDALRSDDFATIGSLLTASHVSLRDDYRISCEELDLAVDTALETGALGSRMTGGGFGGSAIALVRSQDRHDMEQAIVGAFARRRLPKPRLFAAIASAGAGRDD